MKNHLKRIAAPRTWVLNRKQNTFIVRPNAGGHPLSYGLPLGLVVRDILQLATTMSETKKLLHNKTILVDGRQRKDPRFIVGLFDVLSLPDIHKQYRITLDKKGKLCLIEITKEESIFKLGKVVGKTMISKGKTQLHFHDGKNLLVEKTAKVGDTLVLSLPDLQVKEIMPLKEGSAVFLIKGKHSGDVGTLKEIKGKQAVYTVGNASIETATDYLFIIGKDKPFMKVEKI